MDPRPNYSIIETQEALEVLNDLPKKKHTEQ